jgi:hypothetical protein
MAEGTLTEDASTSWYLLKGPGPVHVSGKGAFGSGTIAVEEFVSGQVYASLDATASAIEKTAAFNQVMEFQEGDVIRLTLSGSSSPNLRWKMSGNLESYIPLAFRI